MNISILRIITILLSVVMFLSVLASCSGEKTPQSTDTDVQTQTETDAVTAASTEETTSEIVDAEQVAEPTFVDADFGGQTFTILAGRLNEYEFSDNYIDNDELNGEPVNDAVIERNRAVEEKYNVDIVARPTGVREAKTAAKAGAVDFELVYDSGYYLHDELIAEGLTYDFLQIPHLDLTQEYWVPSLQDDLTFADKMLVATCDISMNHYSWASFIIFNKHLLDGYGIEYPYELVDSGEWTVDKLIELIIQCGTDVNGDSLWTAEDIYGYTGNAVGIATSGAGIYKDCTVKNDDGSYSLNINAEKITEIYNKYANAAYKDGAFSNIGRKAFLKDIDIGQYENEYHAYRSIKYGEGRVAFDSCNIWALNDIGAKRTQYGVLPNPKYDEAQEEYYHYIDNGASLFVVVKQSDMEFVGTVMEYMAYESRQKVFPAFKAEFLEGNTDVRDEAMLDIIFESTYHDKWNFYLNIFSDDENIVTPSMVLNKYLWKDLYAPDEYTEEDCQATIDAAYDFIYNLDVNN